MKRKHIQAHLSDSGHSAIFYGIEFADFIECTPISVENLLFLKGDYCGERDCRGFWLAEGKEGIAELMRKNTYSYGDFCFMDYANVDCLSKLGA